MPITINERASEEATDNSLSCPMCGGATQPGMVAVQGSFLSFLVIGLSWVHCWFEGFNGDRSRLIRCGSRRRGHLCEQCGATVIEGKSFA